MTKMMRTNVMKQAVAKASKPFLDCVSEKKEE